MAAHLHSTRLRRAGRALILFSGCVLSRLHAADPNPAGIEFFEKKIRPIFVEHCYSCHSDETKKVKGGFKLDTRQALLKGGDSGPAIVSGQPDQSRLIKAVRYIDPDLQMPPKDKKLSPEQISNLESWVKMGAPDPRTGASTNAVTIDWQKARSHWAFRPIQEPPIPKVKNRRLAKTPVDAFILARIEASKLSPSPEADKRMLIRRATVDLTGLLPTPEEVEAFIADKSPEAFAAVIDRLLASPHYGERWGRYWLDVARYADTKGYVGGNEEPRYPYAYTYRDWVVRAFNEDLPFDQFIIEQIAADQLPARTNDNRSLAAMGFLTIGRRFLGNENDVIDDRIDVVCRGVMGLTAGCARCHDHKFDPIPTKDYYSLHGVFKSSIEPTNPPLLSVEALHPEYTNYLAELKRREQKLGEYARSNELAVLKNLRTNVANYLLAVHEARALTNNTKLDEFVRGRKLNNSIHRAWKTNLLAWSTNGHPIFTPWTEFTALSTNEFPEKAATLATRFSALENTNHLNFLVTKMFSGQNPTNLEEVAQLYGDLFKKVEKDWDTSVAMAHAPLVLAAGQSYPAEPTILENPDEEAVRQFCFTTNSPLNPTEFKNSFLFVDEVKNKIETLRKDIVGLDATHPGAPPRAMEIVDRPRPVTTRVFLRGNPGTPGPEVPRQFLELIAGENRKPFPTNSSGRLELARALVTRENPLTARVFVNRVWQHHFGTGLVRTTSDFGTRSEPPTHPELLDYLAARFMDEGWSVKKLHRWIMLSRVYQQTSGVEPEKKSRSVSARREPSAEFGYTKPSPRPLSAKTKQAAQLDPDNHLLWRQNRRRLDFEAMRDSYLEVCGKLDPAIGGQPINIVTNPAGRRTIYGLIDRQDLANVFRTFDFANPDTSTGQRFETTVAPQALFLLNSPFIIERARDFVISDRFHSLPGEEQRIAAIYKNIFQRNPSSRELAAGRKFIRGNPADDSIMPEIADWQYGFGGYDPAEKSITNFIALSKFTGTAWQAGTNAPEKKIGGLSLTADGGRPAPTNTVAAIRRWTAPRDGEIKIEGELKNTEARGDGIHARILSSRDGELGEWTAGTNVVETSIKICEVRKGDTIDFAVDCRENSTGDTFKWAPVITMIDPASKAGMMNAGLNRVWDARANFIDPKKLPAPLGAWEKYVQVLLLSNEFAFVD